MNHPTPSILIIEDEQHLASGIAENLTAEGYSTTVARDGRTGLDRARRGSYDLILLDVMLPELDGFSICKQLRAEGCRVPILFLTARGTVPDRIRGLELGGDDYLSKPFHLKELLLRVRAILRREPVRATERPPAQSLLKFGDGCEVNFATFEAVGPGGRATLTQKEAALFRMLVEEQGRVVARNEILDRVWGRDAFPTTRTVDNFIVRFRKIFETDPDTPAHFLTIRGVGYRFVP
ncbi:MAG: response regulator transcription factor [Planctomycetes bacterium]|nr:response regulator transcription factor [Planctomycetota bacterium]